ncbi:MAG: hypothetical protein VX589_21165 [Myxococcota bacterium]|nr:hypothetical protein [Myxococcota bacterium]
MTQGPGLRQILLGCLSLATLAGAAVAQEYRPRILVIFDTSGSMQQDAATSMDTGGDGSLAYPTPGRQPRIFVGKQALRDIIANTSEADFALMSYPQIWGEGINTGDEYTAYDGLDETPLNYSGRCVGSNRANGYDTARAIRVRFPEAGRVDTLVAYDKWLDNFENWNGGNSVELRATGPSAIHESLRLAREYFVELMEGDPDAGFECRKNVVVLFTDGGENCIEPENRNHALRDMARSFRRIPIDRGDDGDMVEKDIDIFVLYFARTVSAIEQLSIVAREGGTAVRQLGNVYIKDLIQGSPYQATDLQEVRAAFGRILAEAIPSESCDGTDEDCDGLVDEGVLNDCGQCGDLPEEECNGVDDDCDGLIDENVRNACGGCGELNVESCNDADDDCDGRIDEGVSNACGGCNDVMVEACNGVDDDCDGLVDNITGTEEPLIRPCGRDVGVCVKGTSQCQDGAWMPCDGVLGSDETCNGLDDDCDGVPDEIYRACGPASEIGNVGECRVGRQQCDFAKCMEEDACDDFGYLIDIKCSGGRGPEPEDRLSCDGRDNDCDGQTDEGLTNACGTCGELPPEACNGEDDDCDGRADENAPCPEGSKCVAGACVQRCRANECPIGKVCVDGGTAGPVCHPDPCLVVRCERGLNCDDDTGRCTDQCADVACAATEACVAGRCAPRPCDGGCDEGQICGASGCRPDPCAEVQCAATEYCRDGSCIAACLNTDCPDDEICVDGVCLDDGCQGQCPNGSLCDPDIGVCVYDPCNGVQCTPETACVQGECTVDAPCATTQCPTGTVCQFGYCTDAPLPSSDPSPTSGLFGDSTGGVTGGQGAMPAPAETQSDPKSTEPSPAGQSTSGSSCGCASSDHRPTPLSALVVVLLLGVRRTVIRRRSIR